MKGRLPLVALAVAAALLVAVAIRSGPDDDEDGGRFDAPAVDAGGTTPRAGRGGAGKRPGGGGLSRPPRTPAEREIASVVEEAARAFEAGDGPAIEAAFGRLAARRAEAVGVLVHVLLDSPDERLRIVAARALAELEAAEAVEALAAALRADAPGEFAHHLLEVLGQLRDPGAVGTLVEFLARDELPADSLLRETARASLVRLGGEEAVDALLPLLVAGGAGAGSAATALGQLGARKAVPFLADLLATAEDPELRMTAARALASLGPEGVRVLSDRATEDPASAAAALRGLAETRDPEFAPLVRDVLAASQDAEVRRTALRVLGAVGGPEDVALLAERIEDSPTDAERIAATESLADLARTAGAPAIDLLERRLRDAPSPAERAAAARGVADGGAEDAVATLAAALAAETDPLARYSLLSALGRTGRPAARPILERALEAEPVADLRAEAARSLGVLGDAAAAIALARSLANDPSPFVRAQVGRALARFGDRSAVPRLVADLRDADPEVRRAAVEALWEITDASIAFDPEAPEEEREPAVRTWETWWAEAGR